MITKHEAIYKLYPQVVTIRGDVAYDEDNNVVEYNQSDVDAEFESNQYKVKRATEYPDFRDYLDGIVKGDAAQVQAYIDACNAVKAKYPKGTE